MSSAIFMSILHILLCNLYYVILHFHYELEPNVMLFACYGFNSICHLAILSNMVSE